MKLKDLYQAIIEKGTEADPRGKKDLDNILKERKEAYDKLNQNKQGFFDKDRLFNLFSDTRILNDIGSTDINSVIVGIDVGGSELLLVDRLIKEGKNINLVMAHHPQGKAYAGFYEVMDVQRDIFTQEGVNLSLVGNLLKERKDQVARRVGAANHERVVDIARWLKLNFICVHTPADNLAYRYIETIVCKAKPRRLSNVMEILMEIPEYKEAARGNNPPAIFIGNSQDRVSHIHVDFTGGTEGPADIYDKLSLAGIDTVIAMHQSEEHFKKCKKAHINSIIASHIASDNLGVNLMLDYLITLSNFKIYEFSGFRRFSHKPAV